jgi:hypothetical protein
MSEKSMRVTIVFIGPLVKESQDVTLSDAFLSRIVENAQLSVFHPELESVSVFHLCAGFPVQPELSAGPEQPA